MTFPYPSDSFFPSDLFFPAGIIGSGVSAKAVPLSPTPATSGQGVVLDVDSVSIVPTALFGWSLAESTGSSPAKVRLHDGTGPLAPICGVITLAQGADSNMWFGDESVEIVSGSLYLDVVSGSVEGCIYLA